MADVDMRVLVVSQRYHPARSVAAVRWTTFVGELIAAGHDVAVLCQGRAGEVDGVGEEVLYALPRGASEAGDLAGARETVGARSWRSTVRHLISAIAIPDSAWLAWARRGRKVVGAARSFDPDVVISTSPPHSVHLVGVVLSRLLSVSLVTDFRDPYVGDSRYDRPRSMPWRVAHRWLERRLVGWSDLVLTAGMLHLRDLQHRYEMDADDVLLLPNGYFPVAGNVEPVRSEGYQAVLVGTCPSVSAIDLAKALGSMERWRQGEMVLVGMSDDIAVECARYIQTRHLGWVEPRRLGLVLAQANLLFMGLSPERRDGGGTSTKLYQYIAAGRPILASNPTAADRQLLSRWADRYSIIDGGDSEAYREAVRSLEQSGDGDAARLEQFRSEFLWSELNGALEKRLLSLRRSRT